MLRKKDLVKEFELVVKQEIIEHNKAVTSSNLAVNNLNIKLDGLNQSNKDQFIKTTNEIAAFKREVELCLVLFNKINDAFTKLKYDQLRLSEKNYKEIQVIDESVETVHRNEQKLEKELSSYKDYLHETDKSLGTLKKVNEHEFHVLKLHFHKELERKIKELLSLPSEAEAVRKEFMEELSMHKIDNEGLLREIKVLKKTVFINEKKIEHLNTLIQRMYTKIDKK